MGSFFGHALPGSFFILFASWWTVQTYRRYYQSLRKNAEQPFRSSATFPIFTKRGWFNIESYLVVISCGLGMFVELGAATFKNHHLGAGNIQHGTMYFFFGLTSLSAIVLPRIKVIPRPDDVVYILLALSYLVEGLLFKFHLFGRASVDVVLHTLLVYTIFSSVIVTLLEMKHRDNVLLPLARAFLTLLQGTWFWQAGFTLYPPFTDPWGKNSPHHHGSNMQDPESHEQEMHEHSLIMFLTCVFTWHMAVILMVMTLCGVFIGLYYKRKDGFDEEALNSRHNNIHPNARGYTTLQQNSIHDDDL